MARRRNPYLRHGRCRGPVSRVRSVVTGVILAGLCPRCGAQTTADEAVLWGEDREEWTTVTADRGPRWEWSEVRSHAGHHVRWVRGQCLHIDTVPVVSSGKTVAHLCLVCDSQLPAGWRPPENDTDAES